MSHAATSSGAARTCKLLGCQILAGLITAILLCPHAFADQPTIFMIEEDWEMNVNDADKKINSPQVAFFLYPNGASDACYFQLQMNYAAEDSYSSGGFRVGAFFNEEPIDEERSEIRETLCLGNDHIRWTSAMAVFNGKLMMAVKDGQGFQWGSFGGPHYLVMMDNHGVNSLNNYDPQTSLDSVDIGFGANRVSSIRLKTVRLTYTDGYTQTINVNQTAH